MNQFARQFEDVLRYQQLQQEALWGAVQRGIDMQLSMLQLQVSLADSFNRNLQKAFSNFSQAALTYGQSDQEPITVEGKANGTEQPQGEDANSDPGRPEENQAQ